MNLYVFTKQFSIISVFYLCFCGYLVSSLVFDSIDSRSEILI